MLRRGHKEPISPSSRLLPSKSPSFLLMTAGATVLPQMGSGSPPSYDSRGVWGSAIQETTSHTSYLMSQTAHIKPSVMAHAMTPVFRKLREKGLGYKVIASYIARACLKQ